MDKNQIRLTWLQIWSSGVITVGSTTFAIGAAMWISTWTLFPAISTSGNEKFVLGIINFFNVVSPIFMISGLVGIIAGFVTPFVALVRKYSKVSIIDEKNSAVLKEKNNKLHWGNFVGYLSVPATIAFASGLSLGFTDQPITVLSIFMASISIGLATAIFAIQQKQGEELQRLVNDVHIFAKEQKNIKEVKRKRYSKMILFSLELVNYEIEGMIVQQLFRDTRRDQSIDDDERKKYQISHYGKAQQAFLDMKVTFDDILEVFGEDIEKKYRQAWNTLKTRLLYFKDNFDNSQKFWNANDKMQKAFGELRNVLTDYAEENEKKDYAELFDTNKIKKKFEEGS